ncbi:MAG: ABC transporter ATP-binding protein [Acidimicrobiales bacterium]
MSISRLLKFGTGGTVSIWGALGKMKTIAAISAVLSLSIAGVESLAMAGLVTLLTAGTGAAQISSGLTDHIANAPAVLALGLISLALNAVQTWVRERVTGDWELQLRLELIDAFRRADYSTQANYPAGRLSVDGENIASGGNTIGGIIGLIGFASRTFVYGIVSVVASWQVAGIAVMCGSVLVFLLRMISRRTRKLNDRVALLYRDVTEDIVDLAPTARELHALNRWSTMIERITEQLREIRLTRFTARALAAMVGPAYATGTLVIGAAVAEWARGGSDQSTTRLAVSGLLLIRCLGSAQSTQVGFQSVNDSLPYMDRGIAAIEDLRARARVTDSIEHSPDAADEPRLEVFQASISYGNDTVVRDLTLSLGGRGGVALIGPSGAGKSTTLLALSGLLRPDTGLVLCDGADMADLDLSQVTDTIGYLPQDPRLIRATLRDNLVRWPQDPTDDDLTARLDRVGLMATVNGFDGGLDATMGRSAEGLSGGELQRLGLVRLLLAKPRIMLLDEPTSALDRLNADRVASEIAAAMEDHLVILVTHRPDLLLHCSELIYMEAGSIVDRGTLSDLAERNRFVAAMARELEV